MELIMIFALVMFLLLAVMLFIALGFFRGTFRGYPPPYYDPNNRVPAPPPVSPMAPLPPERRRDSNWRGV